jgi:hypothetical protein
MCSAFHKVLLVGVYKVVNPLSSQDHYRLVAHNLHSIDAKIPRNDKVVVLPSQIKIVDVGTVVLKTMHVSRSCFVLKVDNNNVAIHEICLNLSL